MNHRISILALLTLFIILGPNKPFAQEKHDCGLKCKKLFSKGLTEEQENQIKKLHLEFDKEILSLKGDIDVKSAEMKKLLITEDPDQKVIEQKIEEIGKLQIKMEKLRTQKQLKIRALLTPEQRIEFNKHIFMKSKHHQELCGKGCGHKKLKLMKCKEKGEKDAELKKGIHELEESEE